MTWDEALIAIKSGAKISASRLGDGAYVELSTGSESDMTLHSENGQLQGWSPALSDQSSNEWYILN
ncbi:Thoeris anti-defense Tad2 family protein [Rahnella sp. PCH160]|uniref:Thoeris anti-defense Tad2 family protein n=1 Tax=Rahnella sp. PCH160 TaxID=3447928 RepID=UPI0039FD84F8